MWTLIVRNTLYLELNLEYIEIRDYGSFVPLSEQTV